MNDPFAKHRESFINQVFEKSHIDKFRILYDIYPCTFQHTDIAIIGGNDVIRLAAFIKANILLLNGIPKIAVGFNLNPKSRAELLRHGYDDVLNLKTAVVGEVRARVSAIMSRYEIKRKVIANRTNEKNALDALCDNKNLTPAESAILSALNHAPRKFCSLLKLCQVASKYHDSITSIHLRVIVYSLRKKISKDYALKSVRGEGYRLERLT